MNRRDKRSGAGTSGNQTQDLPAADPESGGGGEDARRVEGTVGEDDLFGLNEQPEVSAKTGHWPTGAELTEAENGPSPILSGAGDWVLQLDGAEIEFTGLERAEPASRGSRIQMWDGSELIFEEEDQFTPEDRGADGDSKAGG